LTQGSYPVVVTVGGVASQSVNLIVGQAPVTITSVSPSPVPLSANPQTVIFTGSGFQTGLGLKLQSPSSQVSTVPASSITFVSSTLFTARITVGTTAGSWGALVDNPDGTESSVFNFTASCSSSTPSITSIVTTSSQASQIAPNTWIEVHGKNLSPSTLDWSYSDFNGGLPTTLGCLSAMVDNKPAAVFYVSPTQVNILAPLDSATGSVAVQLTNQYGQTTANGTATEAQTSPAFLVFDVAGHVAAQHVPSFSLLGPPSLDQPGYTFTAASPGEKVVIYATGFGQTNPTFTNQLTATGLTGADPFPLNLPSLPTVTIGNLPATVSFAGLVGPGLYQLNLTVPASAPAGDLPIVASYNGVTTQSTALITVQ
jgi:uncharacterized protein (TIGR03437 family)